MQRRVALVTGANRGLGLEIARQLAELGITVIIGSRDHDRGQEAADSLRNDRREVYSRLLDVTKANTIQAAIGYIVDQFGRLDILVNNAGIMIDTETNVLELDLTLYQNTLETNALGPLLLSQACVPHMRANHYGRIVNISSTLGSLTDIVSGDMPARGSCVGGGRRSSGRWTTAVEIISVIFQRLHVFDRQINADGVLEPRAAVRNS